MESYNSFSYMFHYFDSKILKWQSLTDSGTKGRYRAARAAKNSPKNYPTRRGLLSLVCFDNPVAVK